MPLWDPNRSVPSLLRMSDANDWPLLERQRRRAELDTELAAAEYRLWEIASGIMDEALELREADVEDVDAIYDAIGKHRAEVKELVTQIDALTAAKDRLPTH